MVASEMNLDHIMDPAEKNLSTQEAQQEASLCLQNSQAIN
jgi:hypothetical protein